MDADFRGYYLLVRLRRIERPHPVPETGALSTELQAQFINCTKNIVAQFTFFRKFFSYFSGNRI